MITYLFQLGRNLDLSVAELSKVLNKEPKDQINDIVFFDLPEISEPQKLQDRLGGSVKIMRQLHLENLSTNQNAETLIKNYITENIEELVTIDNQRILFALSKFNININSKEILNFLKFFLKKSLNKNARALSFSNQNPKPGSIYKSRIIKKGFELNVVKNNNKLIIAKTITVQNINKYVLRDYKKPARDARIGMLPPKLSQIMLNLSGESQKIYDPFCGTGTILIEGLLMGKQVWGSDFNPDMIDASEKNLYWASRKFQLPQDYEVKLLDATKITPQDFGEKFDAIVTESYLGPAKSAVPSEKERHKTYQELTKLNTTWLRKSKETLNKGAKIVFCFPNYQEKNKVHEHKKIDQEIEKLGFKIENKFYYSRNDQIVGRRIFVLSI